MKIIRGTVILVIGGVVSSMIAAVTGLILARVLGPEEFGMYNLALALPYAFTHMFLFGVDTIIVRETARRPQALRNVSSIVRHPKGAICGQCRLVDRLRLPTGLGQRSACLMLRIHARAALTTLPTATATTVG